MAVDALRFLVATQAHAFLVDRRVAMSERPIPLVLHGPERAGRHQHPLAKTRRQNAGATDVTQPTIGTRATLRADLGHVAAQATSHERQRLGTLRVRTLVHCAVAHTAADGARRVLGM